jgi:hypothetical protein
VTVQTGCQTLNNLNPKEISFLGKSFLEDKLLGYAYAYEQSSMVRMAPSSTLALAAESIVAAPGHLPVMGVGGAFPLDSVAAPLHWQWDGVEIDAITTS